jgi:hypothetical protein
MRCKDLPSDSRRGTIHAETLTHTPYHRERYCPLQKVSFSRDSCCACSKVRGVHSEDAQMHKTNLTRNTCMQQPLAYIFQTLTYMKLLVIDQH